MHKDNQKNFNTKVSSFVAQKCPVCNGFGTLKWGQLTCHACLGKGYITIPAKSDRKKDEKQHS